MKKLSLIFSILMLHVATGHGMEFTPADTNLYTLPAETFIEMNYYLDSQSINAIRCINKLCNQKMPSQEQINKNLLLAIPKALEDDNGAPLRYWKQRGAYAEKIFLNLLETGQKNFARFVYSECNLNANNALELASKYGNIDNVKLLIADYYADDTNRALTTAVRYGFKDLAIMLIRKYQAKLYFVCETAARNGDIKQFKLSIEIYCTDAGYYPLSKTAAGCAHSDVESCGHKEIIILLNSEYHIPITDEALIEAVQLGQEGMVQWLITHYKSNFSQPAICNLISMINTHKANGYTQHSQAKQLSYNNILHILESSKQT